MLKQNKTKRKKHEVSSNIIAIASSIVILLGFFIFSYNYIKVKKNIAYTSMTNVFYKEQEEKQDNTQENIEEDPQRVEEQKPSSTNNEYIGYLEIPKIKLKKGFVKKESINNDVEKNIFIANASDYPDKEKGNFIIAGHSGTGWKAFFNNLYKLATEDAVYVTYKNKKYTYKIRDIYTQKKTGTIEIYRDYNQTTLTLVTCTNQDDSTQTIYIAYLEKIENE